MPLFPIVQGLPPPVATDPGSMCVDSRSFAELPTVGTSSVAETTTKFPPVQHVPYASSRGGLERTSQSVGGFSKGGPASRNVGRERTMDGWMDGWMGGLQEPRVRSTVNGQPAFSDTGHGRAGQGSPATPDARGIVLGLSFSGCHVVVVVVVVQFKASPLGCTMTRVVDSPTGCGGRLTGAKDPSVGRRSSSVQVADPVTKAALHNAQF
ncbi:hypothetical protein PMIN01_09205 [Paraphaeosphaeria minitans]|uniref:Uncharacterized protein n=1 Tax=Paraphaeosphaeria minitans TaxID=565426 RepID=A0A9P6GAV5_9PLEO|nr:hypothetical protein PMIN01_09205 [Paraphaeosphaeria minitans]